MKLSEVINITAIMVLFVCIATGMAKGLIPEVWRVRFFWSYAVLIGLLFLLGVAAVVAGRIEERKGQQQ